MRSNFLYGLPREYKGLINRYGMREKPAVIYPASGVDSDVVRADMESASPQRQSIQAAGVQLPEELSASNGVDASQFAMMVDQSLRKGGYVNQTSIDSLSRHRVSGSLDFLTHSGYSPRIRFAVTQGRVADPGELVGQGTSGLVVIGPVLNAKRPLSQSIDLFASRMRNAGRSQNRSGAMRQQHAQIPISTLGYTAKFACAAGRMFFGCETKPAREVAGIFKMGDTPASSSDHGGRSQQPDARHGQQCRARWRQFGQSSQLTFKLINSNFEQPDFLNKESHRGAYQGRNGRFRIGKHAANLLNPVAAAGRNGNSELAAKSSQSVDPRGARSHPQRASPMYALERLLLNSLNFNGNDVGTPSGFQQCARIGRVGLIAFNVRPDISCGQKLNFDAKQIELASPMMSRPARLHNDERYTAIDEPALELAAGKAMLLSDAPVGVGDSELKYRFGQVNGHGSSIHGGLLLLTDPRPHVDQSAHVGAKRQGESIPSINRTASALRAPAAGNFARWDR